MRFKPLVMCGPSGAGKSTFTDHIMHMYPNLIQLSISSTTRAPRSHEVDGVHYHFISRDVFQQQIEAKNFLEYNHVHGNIYGTHKADVQAVIEAGKICLLDIDIQGARNISESGINCNYLFIKTPSIKALEERLCARKTETAESLRLRIKNARQELKEAEESKLFDTFLVNDDKEKFILEATSYFREKYDI